MNIHAAVSVLALAAYAGLAVASLPRKDSRELFRRVFLVYLLLMVVQQAVYLLVSMASTPEEALRGYVGLLVASSAPWPAFYVLVRALLGRPHRWVALAVALVWLPPTVLSVFLASPSVYRSLTYDAQVQLFVPEFGPWAVLPGVVVFSFAGLAAWELVRALRQEERPTERLRAGVFLLGLGVVLGGQLLNSSPTLRAHPVDVVANVLHALVIAWAVTQLGLVQVPQLTRQLLSRTLPATLVLLVWLLALRVAGGVDTVDALLFAVLAAALTVPLSRHLGERLGPALERLLLPRQHLAGQVLRRVGARAASETELDQLARLLLQELTGTLGLPWAALLTRAPDQGRWILVEAAPDQEGPSPWTQEQLTSLGEALERAPGPVPSSEPAPWDAQLTLHAYPLRSREELVGALVVAGQERSDAPVLLSLAQQTAVSIDNARLLQHLRRELLERERAEAERARMQERVVHMQKMEAVGSLASGVAHDMNNVLGAVMALASAMRTDLDQGRDMEGADLEEILTACRRGRDLTDALLGFARKQAVRPQAVDVVRVLLRVSRLLARTLPRSIEVRVEAPEPLGLVEVDPSQLDMVLVNLCLNAAAAMEQGGTITLGADQVRVDEDEEVEPGPYLRVQVVDDGRGMDTETVQRAFDPFFTTRAGEGGTGLGLAQVYGIVRSHGGKVAIQSTPGQGTTVTLLLPALDRARASASPAPASARIHLTELRVLLVDDEPLLRRAGTRLLTRLGCQVQTAAGGQEALDLLAAQPEGVDLVVLDMIMPGMDGEATFHALRERVPGLPVVVCSGYSEHAKAQRLRELPGVAFVPKPFDAQTLTAAILELVEE